jgi:type IV secretory pathway VirB4 component
VNGLLALWGFVDETTFLTKAGHVGVVYRLRGVDYEGLTHAAAPTLVHRFEAALRLLDEHCRVYQYLVKRTVAPVRRGAVRAAGRHEAIQRRAAYLNGRRHELFDLELYLVLLYEPPHVGRAEHGSRACGARRGGAAGLAVDRTPRSRSSRRARPRHRHAAPQGAGVRGAAERLRPARLPKATRSASSASW